GESRDQLCSTGHNINKNTIVKTIAIFIVNSLTDKSDVQPPSSATLRASQKLLSTLYLIALLATSKPIIQNISVKKNERITSLGGMFSIQQLLGTMVVVLAIGVFAKRISMIHIAAFFACLLDLVLGYRVVVVLGLLGGTVLRASVCGKITKALIPLFLISLSLGLVLKPIYYRLESSRPISVQELGTYVAEGLKTYEGNGSATVFQTTISAPEVLQLPPLTALFPSILPLGGSIFGEPKGFSDSFSSTFYPETPWGFGGSLLGESLVRGGVAALIASIALIITLSRIRLRSDVGRSVILYCAPFVFFYSFRADIAYTLDAVSKITCLGVIFVLIARHPLTQNVLGIRRDI
ncbi:hypothetical protein EBT31_22500, partial [bacterium]|nr:hypothetical protein [bacterium]